MPSGEKPRSPRGFALLPKFIRAVGASFELQSLASWLDTRVLLRCEGRYMGLARLPELRRKVSGDSPTSPHFPDFPASYMRAVPSSGTSFGRRTAGPHSRGSRRDR